MLYTEWTYSATTDSPVTIMPDGCRDILIIEHTTPSFKIQFTDWDDCARTVRLTTGQRFIGFRLRPGLTVNYKDLVNLEINAEEIKQFIVSEADINDDSSDVIEALGTNRITLQEVVKQLGVSIRTLQRHFSKLGLPSPEYWRLLSRARSAAASLSSRTPLVEIADMHGYSDQSHMTREFVRWFGVTPHHLRSEATLLSEVCQPGVGNWTFEHISMR